MKKIAIVQSNYIPWKGYFDLIAHVDEFILYDDVQYTKRDWRNRNRIKTPTGLQWLTVPVLTKGSFKQKINETKIDGTKWQIDHWQSLEKNYSRAPYFIEVSSWLKPLFTENSYIYISELNRRFLFSICSYLGIKTKISSSSDYKLFGDKTERLANLCVQSYGTEYVSGPAAKSYIDESVFSKMSLNFTWFNYGTYKEYPQQWSGFDHKLSILDLLFNCGEKSTIIYKSS